MVGHQKPKCPVKILDYCAQNAHLGEKRRNIYNCFFVRKEAPLDVNLKISNYVI